VNEVGAQNFILATDLGQTGNPTDLMKAGLSKDQITTMGREAILARSASAAAICDAKQCRHHKDLPCHSSASLFLSLLESAGAGRAGV
jgi:hypothetical protein